MIVEELIKILEILDQNTIIDYIDRNHIIQNITKITVNPISPNKYLIE